MNYKELPEEQRQNVETDVNARANELKTILRNLAVSLTKYLITANAGGALAVLTYVHTNNQPMSNYIRVSLGSFVAGILFISTALIWLYWRAWRIEENYLKDRNLFFGNQISLSELNRRDNERCESDVVEYILAFLSFLAFFAGVVFGALNFL